MASLATTAVVAGIAGAATSAYGAVQAGQAQAAESKYQSQVAANNATIAQQNANFAIASGQTKAQQESLKASEQLAAVKSAIAANNVDVNTGSASDVQTSERDIGRLDTLTTMNNAMLEAYGYQSQGTGYTAASGLEKFQAEQAPIGADISAAGGLLSNASSVGLKWSQLNSGGATATGGGDTTIGAYGAS